MSAYRLGSIDTRRGNDRPLIREDGEVIAYVQSDAGPAIVGEMTEEQARKRFPDAFRSDADADAE